MNYAFSDFKTGLNITSSGNVEIIYDEDVIFQSLRHIFSTIVNERVRNPIGCQLIRYLFEPVALDTAREIRNELRTILELWEPRVDILNISVIPEEDQNTYRVKMEIDIPILRKRSIFSTRLRSFVE